MNEDYIYAKISEEEDDEEEGPVLSLHETILLLDRLVKGGNGIDCEYVSSEMEKAYPLLRQAALDGERYKRAGEELANAIEAISSSRLSTGGDNLRHAALEAYRQAVEQKEV